jgi:hypothetical protein
MPHTRNPKPDTLCPIPETRNPKPETPDLSKAFAFMLETAPVLVHNLLRVWGLG